MNVFSMLLAAMGLGAGPSDEVVAKFEARAHVYTGGEYDKEEFHYRVLRPDPIEPGKQYPLVFFLHGAGERGEDNRLQLKYLPELMATPEYRKKFPCFLIAPQCRADKWWTNFRRRSGEGEAPAVSDQMRVAEEILQTSLKMYPVDANRVYLTGLSMGGYGSWDLAARHPDWFAAVVPICGGGDETKAAALVKVPIWTFHGASDQVVAPEQSRKMIDAIRAAGGQPKYTELEGVGHDSWTPAYTDPEGVIPWMFKQVNERGKQTN